MQKVDLALALSNRLTNSSTQIFVLCLSYYMLTSLDFSVIFGISFVCLFVCHFFLSLSFSISFSLYSSIYFFTLFICLSSKFSHGYRIFCGFDNILSMYSLTICTDCDLPVLSVFYCFLFLLTSINFLFNNH